MEILEKQTPKCTPQNSEPTIPEHVNLKNTQVCCQKAPNSLGLHKLVNTTKCLVCEKFLGLNIYGKEPLKCTRVMCSSENTPLKLLDCYTHCCLHKRTVKVKEYCLKCIYYNGFEQSTCRVKCSKAKLYQSTKPNSKVAVYQQNKELNLNFPFEYPCPIKGKSTFKVCLQECLLFKGIHKYGKNTLKIQCTHKKATESEYVSVKRRDIKTIKPPKKKHTIFDLSFLFEDPIKAKKLGITVDCIGAEKVHYSHSINVNCLSNGLSIEECRLCPHHLGIKGFRVNCKLYPTAIFVPHCPHGKGATHRKGGQVSLQTCVECPQFLRIEDDKVHCRYTKLQGYVSKPPKRNRNISPLTHKEKVYIDIPD